VVRQQARKLAEQHRLDLVLIDGSPGIGCPVIASVTGASLVLAVTEPTPSGEHDLKRVVQLVRHFDIPLAVCINKWDLNPAMSDGIEKYCRGQSIPVTGRIRYDRVFTRAQIQRRTVVEASNEGVVADIRGLWNAVQSGIELPGRKECGHHATSPS
jgi:MinD superfamily P-loop ATPase